MNNFEPIDFTALNEADIREEVIAPLLRKLGYKSGTSNNVIREQSLSLKYPKAFLGRKKPNSDPILRGKADYICDIEQRLRWIIEAKPPNVEISIDDIEQAFTYANHPEVRAVIFCLCNGQELKIFQTDLAPDAALLLTIDYADFDKRFDEIANILAPESIKREFPTITVDTGKPIGLGLRSIVRVINGHIKYKQNNYNLPQLKDFTLAIIGGSIERNENGQLVATLKTLSPFASLQKLFEKIGMSEIEAISDDNVASINPQIPTKFVSTQKIIMPKGEKMLDILTWKEILIPTNITVDTYTEGNVTLKGNTFSGSFYIKIDISLPSPPLEVRGDFEFYVA